MATETDVTAQLRAWAKGLYPLEAAVELLIRAFDGRFAGPGQPWVKQEDGTWWVDADVVVSHGGALSGGERRVLAVVASLLSDEHPVSLGQVLLGLDRDLLALVLAACSHANGGAIWPAP